MGKLSFLPPNERPKEKALRYGVSTLSDGELLAIIINSGYEGVSAKEIGEELLYKFKGLHGLINANFVELNKVKGIKKNKALTISVIIELAKRLNSPSEVDLDKSNIEEYLLNKYYVLLKDNKQECLYLVLTDRFRRIIKEVNLYQGTGDNIIFSYHDIFRELFTNNARGFILFHNHPDGTCKPSSHDLLLTNEIKKESLRIKIPLLNHYIIGYDGIYSCLENKKVNFNC